MIIYGWMSTKSSLNSQQFYCPSCRARRTADIKSVDSYYMLFFIPLIPKGSGGMEIECTHCGWNRPFRREILDYDPDLLTNYVEGREPGELLVEEPIDAPRPEQFEFAERNDTAEQVRRRASSGVSMLALGSLMLAILSLLGSAFPLFAVSIALTAIIAGHLAHVVIKRSHGFATGRGFALFGVVLGYTLLVGQGATYYMDFKKPGAPRDGEVQWVRVDRTPRIEPPPVAVPGPVQVPEPEPAPVKPPVKSVAAPRPEPTSPEEKVQYALDDLRVKKDVTRALGWLLEDDIPLVQRKPVSIQLAMVAEEGNFYDRLAATQALAVWGDERAAKKLLTNLKPYDAEQLRFEALATAVKIGGPPLAPLVPLVGDVNERAGVIAALKSEKPEMEAQLVALLPAGKATLQLAVCEVLGMRGTKRSIPALRKLAGETTDDALRDRAAWAEATIEGRERVKREEAASGDTPTPTR